MPDRSFFSIAIGAALAMIILSLVWPQGTGARSPGPFGHRLLSPTAAAAKK